MPPAALAPFTVRSFRFQWPADLLTSWAMEMESLILGWYVLVETGSVLLLTVFGALQYLGTLLAPLLGVASDRIGHRNLLCGMRAVYTVLAAVLMVLAFTGMISPLAVLVVVAFNGLVRPSDLGVRTALIAHTLPSDRLLAAMSISRTTQDTARIAGALAGAGLMVAFGMGPAYVAITSFYVLGALLTLGVAATAHSAIDPAAEPSASPWRDFRKGIAYIWSTRSLHAAIWLAFLINLTAYPISNGLLPYVAKDIYGLDQTGLGYLLASFAAGALLGSIALSQAGARLHLSRLMIVSAALWYAVLLIFAQVQSAVGGAVCLVLAGFVQSLSIVCVAVVLMRAAGAEFRGRVMGARTIAIYGLPLGLLGAGFLVGRVGFGATATLYAAVGLLVTLAIAVRWRVEAWSAGEPGEV
jgi:Na+/melibiose symporter-like transporter